MKTTDTHAFVNQILICLLVTFSFGGTIGLGTVWLRHQNAVLARSNRALEAKIAEVRRSVTEWTAMVESEKSSDVMRRRNAEFQLGFAPATDKQITHMPEDPIQRLARRNRGEIMSDGLVGGPIRFATKH
jgi:hypothetical protein